MRAVDVSEDISLKHIPVMIPEARDLPQVFTAVLSQIKNLIYYICG